MGINTKSRSMCGQMMPHNEMLRECRVTHGLWAIWDVKYDDGTYFLFDSSKCQLQVKLGQSLKFNIFSQNMSISPTLSHDLKSVIHFYVWHLRCKKVFQKSGVIPFAYFLPLHSQTLRYCFEILCFFVYRLIT